MQLNIEQLKVTFESVGFPVKVADKIEGFFKFEYNPPDDISAIAMRTAFARQPGVDVMTLYRYEARAEARGNLLQRERVMIPWVGDDAIRKVFHEVIDHFNLLMDERGTSPYRRSTNQPPVPVRP